MCAVKQSGWLQRGCRDQEPDRDTEQLEMTLDLWYIPERKEQTQMMSRELLCVIPLVITDRQRIRQTNPSSIHENIVLWLHTLIDFSHYFTVILLSVTWDCATQGSMYSEKLLLKQSKWDNNHLLKLQLECSLLIIWQQACLPNTSV